MNAVKVWIATRKSNTNQVDILGVYSTLEAARGECEIAEGTYRREPLKWDVNHEAWGRRFWYQCQAWTVSNEGEE